MTDYDTRSQEGAEDESEIFPAEVYAVRVTQVDSEWHMVAETWDELKEMDGDEWSSDQCANCGGSSYRINAAAAPTVICQECGWTSWVMAHPASKTIF